MGFAKFTPPSTEPENRVELNGALLFVVLLTGDCQEVTSHTIQLVEALNNPNAISMPILLFFLL